MPANASGDSPRFAGDEREGAQRSVAVAYREEPGKHVLVPLDSLGDPFLEFERQIAPFGHVFMGFGEGGKKGGAGAGVPG